MRLRPGVVRAVAPVEEDCAVTSVTSGIRSHEFERGLCYMSFTYTQGSWRDACVGGTGVGG
jgi:hypothetical protein